MPYNPPTVANRRGETAFANHARGEETMAVDVARLQRARPGAALPFRVNKLGHVVILVSDLERSTEFYTQALGFQVSDVYPEEMVPGGMVFLRCNPDHHCLALIGGGGGEVRHAELNHIAFEVASLEDVFRARAHLEARRVPIAFEGRRRAGCQVAIEFHDPDGHHLELYWGVDQVGTEGRVRAPSQWRHAHTLEEAIDHPPPGQVTRLRDPSLRRRE
jgi:catechol 2,3-dioxygenase